MKMYKYEKTEHIYWMILFIVELFAKIKRLCVLIEKTQQTQMP